MTGGAFVRHLGMSGLFVNISTLATPGEGTSTTTSSMITREHDEEGTQPKNTPSHGEKCFKGKPSQN